MEEQLLPPPPKKKPESSGLLPPPPKKGEPEGSGASSGGTSAPLSTPSPSPFAPTATNTEDVVTSFNRRYSLEGIQKRLDSGFKLPQQPVEETGINVIEKPVAEQSSTAKPVNTSVLKPVRNSEEIDRGKRTDAYDVSLVDPDNDPVGAEQFFQDAEADYLDYLKATDENKFEETAATLEELRRQKANGDLSVGQQEKLRDIRNEAVNLKNKAVTRTLTVLQQTPEYAAYERQSALLEQEKRVLQSEIESNPNAPGLQEKIDAFNQKQENIKKTSGFDKIEGQYNNAYGQYINPTKVRSQNANDYPELLQMDVANRSAKEERTKAAEEGNTEFLNAASGTIGRGVLGIAQVPKIVSDLFGATDYSAVDELYDKIQGVKDAREGTFGQLDDAGLPNLYKMSRLAGDTAGSIALFASGGLGAATKTGQLAATVGTSFLTTQADYYSDALAMGKSPKEAAKEASALAFVTSVAEAAVPDIKYFNPSDFRKSVLNAVTSGKPFKEALKTTIDALPDATKAYLKSGTKEGGEEVLQQGAEDVTKEGINAVTEGEDYETFDPKSYVQSVLGGFMGGAGMNVFSRPGPKPPDVETAMRDAVENREGIVKDLEAVDPEKAAAVDEVLVETQTVLDALKGIPGFEKLSTENQNHLLAELQRKKQLEQKQKELGVEGIVDEEVAKIDAEVAKTLGVKTETEAIAPASDTKSLTGAESIQSDLGTKVEEVAEIPTVVVETGYRAKHQIKEPATTADNLLKAAPEDLFENINAYYDLSEKPTKESYRVLKGIKDNPDAEVTIYRSVPSGVDKINPGDWVSLSKTYAQEHGAHEDDPSQDMPVISMKVKASEVGWDGNDINEFSYNPKEAANAETTATEPAMVQDTGDNGGGDSGVVQEAAVEPEETAAHEAGETIAKEKKEDKDMPHVRVTNSYTQAVRAARGKDPIAKQASQKNSDLWERVTSRFENGEADIRQEIRNMAEDAKVSPTDENQATVLFDRIRIVNEKETIADQLDEAIKEGDTEAELALTERMAGLEAEQELNDQVNERLGAEWGRTGQFRQMAADREYGIHNIIKEATALNRGKELSPEQKKRFEDLARNYETLQREHRKLQEKILSEQAKTEEKKKQKVGDALRKFADKVEAGKISKLAGFKSSTGFDAIWDSSLTVVAQSIRAGATIADAVEAGLTKIRESQWYQDLKNKNEFDEKYRNHITDEFDKEADPEEYQKRRQNRLNQLTQKLANKDFGTKAKKKAPVNPEIRDVNRKIRALEEEIEKEKETIRLKNLTTGEKIKHVGLELWNLPKSLMAGLDFSSVGRQGAFLIGKPKAFAKAFTEMFRQAFSQKNYDNWLRDLKSTPDYQEMKDWGLYIAEPSAKLSAREEQFASKYIQYINRIPGYGHLMQISNRAYSAFLNVQRVQVFQDFKLAAEEAGVSGEELENELKNYARFVNNATGRGNLGFAEAAAPVLNGLMFSPRLLASRVNLLNPVFYARLSPRARRDAIFSLAKFTGIATLTGLLIKMGWGCPDDCEDCDDCAQIELSPKSSDFLKIRFGNTRYDMLGGFQQLIRTATQVITGERKNTATGEVEEIKNPNETLGDFFVNKASPAGGVLLDVIRGKDKYTGEDITVTGELKKLTVPLSVQSAMEIYEGEGLGGMIAPTLIATFGVGVQYYGTVKQEANKIYNEKVREWDKKHDGELTEEQEKKLMDKAEKEAQKKVDSDMRKRVKNAKTNSPQ